MTATKRKIDPFTTRSGWTAARRLAQARRLRERRPWLRSTGPKTLEGKAVVAMNACKHGGRDKIVKQVRVALRLQRRFITAIDSHEKFRRLNGLPFDRAIPRWIQILGRQATVALIASFGILAADNGQYLQKQGSLRACVRWSFIKP